MTTQNTKTAMFDIQSLLNPKGGQDLIKSMASMNQRMTAIFIEAGTRSVEIVSNTAKEALSNLGEATQVLENPADYAKVYSKFAQKQMDLMTHTAQDVGEVTQKAGTETKELASEAGEEMSEKVAANAKEVTDKITSASEEMSDKVAANAKEATDKITSAAKDATDKATADKAGSASKKSS
ncbi:phasin family protein [Sulfitobacter sp.]|uniref:phasin family protein n=1 Tax=Sulfitobacter sp. TaxID=1903071 RepID=UPI00300184D2